MSVQRIKRVLVGRPIPTSLDQHERRGRVTGLAVYAVGAFRSFTLKQGSMVRYRLTRRPPGWVSDVAVQGISATATGLALVVIAVTKSTHGAWIVGVLIPMLAVAFVTVRRHYGQMARQLPIERALLVRKGVIVTNAPYHLEQ